ncbi:Clavesin-1 [Oopsacas minuta]|uniref:Clavesin-1 n=1 Tax=Oopsacas minuta TaxID=111878 RepID=A0AAV7JCC0_9METZ|nr:Clavesin-1 [Oopsacas minuta]
MDTTNSMAEGATASRLKSIAVNNFGEEGPGDMTPSTREKAQRELNETEEGTIIAIAELKQLIANDPKISEIIDRTDDSFYLKYLRARKFDVERSFRLAQNHALYPERIGQPHIYYRSLTPGQVLALEEGVIGVLAKRDNLGRKILVLFPGKWNTETMPLAEMHSLCFLLLNIMIESEETQVNGFMVLCDATGLFYRQLLSVITNRDLVSHIVHLIQETFPGRFKEAIIIKHPWYVSLIKTMVFPLIKKKFRDRIHILGGGHANIAQRLGPDCLPEDFNGSQPKYDPAFFTQAIQEAINNNYPPFKPCPPGQDISTPASLSKLHKRHSSLLSFPTTSIETKLEKSLSLQNIDDEFHDAISFSVSTPLP